MLVVVVYDSPDDKRGKRPNRRQSIMLSRFEGFLRGISQVFIDTPQQIAETLYFSLRCVDGLQGKGLRYVLESIFGRIC